MMGERLTFLSAHKEQHRYSRIDLGKYGTLEMCLIILHTSENLYVHCETATQEPG